MKRSEKELVGYSENCRKIFKKFDITVSRIRSEVCDEGKRWEWVGLKIK